MKRTFIAAILFAITASNVNAQQPTTIYPQYWVAPNGYQTQVPQFQTQNSQPRYQPQTLQSNQHQAVVPQQFEMQSSYYPHQPSVVGGVVSQPLQAAPAKLQSVLQNSLQVESQVPEVDLSYLELPTKAPAPAPSIPPQPEDLAIQPVKPAQSSVLNREPTEELSNSQQASSLAPAPSIPAEPVDLVMQPVEAKPAEVTPTEVKPAEVAQPSSLAQPSQELPKSEQLALPSTTPAPVAPVQPEVAQPEELLVPSESATVVSDDLPETKLEAQVEPSVDGELDLPNSMVLDQKTDLIEDLAAEDLLSAEELSGTAELEIHEKLATDELAVTEDQAVELGEVAMAEFDPGTENQASEPKLEDVDLKNKAVDSVVAIDTTPAVVAEDSQANAAQSMVNAPAVASGAIAAKKRHASEKTVATKISTPVKNHRSRSYGGWLLVLIPLLGLPLIGWLAYRKKKRDRQARFAAVALERAVSRTRTNAAKPSLASIAKPEKKETKAAPVVAAASAKVETTKPLAAKPVVPAKPIVPAKPVVEAKPVVAAKPVVETKPVVEAKPASRCS